MKKCMRTLVRWDALIWIVSLIKWRVKEFHTETLLRNYDPEKNATSFESIAVISSGNFTLYSCVYLQNAGLDITILWLKSIVYSVAHFIVKFSLKGTRYTAEKIYEYHSTKIWLKQLRFINTKSLRKFLTCDNLWSYPYFSH